MTLRYCVLLASFCLPSFSNPLSFGFDTGPPWLDTGSPVTFTPLTFPSGHWFATGGNPGGYIEDTIIGQHLVFPGSSVIFGAGIVANDNNVDNRFLLFGPTDYGISISFDYRTSLTFTGSVPITSDVWDVQIGTGGNALIGTFPFIPDDGIHWSHASFLLTSQNFPGLPSDPVAAGNILRTFNTFAIERDLTAANPDGTYTFVLDIDNLTFGNPIPEPSPGLLLLTGIGLMGILRYRNPPRRRS